MSDKTKAPTLEVRISDEMKAYLQARADEQKCSVENIVKAILNTSLTIHNSTKVRR